MKKASLIILYGLVWLAIGFFIGRSTIDTLTKVEYVKGPTVSGSVSPTLFISTKEEKPNIQYRDTGSIRYISTTVDTAAIIADYEMKRTYNVVAFDNKELGKLELFPVIQYNKLSALDYNFTPVIERQTISKTKILQPFGSVSYSTLNYVGIGGGFFYHNLGFEYQYQKSFSDKFGDGHSLGLKYRF